MEHRCSVRKPVELQLLLYKHGLPIQRGVSRDLGLGGMFVETGTRTWRKNENLEIEFLGENGQSAIRLSALVVHHSSAGVGLMFNAVSNEQRRVLRGSLFNNAEAAADLVPAVPRAVA
ncbi:MAG: hypothetical protein GWP13_00235 [Planctomycetia bacterium]|nr:hypothetical protein [Planctomycetia bacterium]